MKNFTMEDLKRLMSVESDLCISLYMPTDPAAVSTDEQRIRFKNLLRQAEKTGQDRVSNKKAFNEMIEEGRRLLKNDYFWRYQSDGLAVFIAPEVFLFYKLPLTFEEDFTAGRRFHVKPLLPLFMADGRFYILALSQKQIRLFSCTRHSAMEIDLVDVPDGIAETLRYDEKEYQLQWHTETAGARGSRPAMFHGHGVGVDEDKEEITRYFRDVDRGLSKILPEQEVPLVLAGVDFLMPIFKETTSYGWVMQDAVTGNPDGLRAEELHKKALEIVLPALEENQRSAESRYGELAGKGYTAAGVRSVVPAAAYGKVDTLFVALDERRPGTFDRQKNQVIVSEEEGPETHDLLDIAAVETIQNGGKVYAIGMDRMPEEHAAAAAILRY